MPTHSEKRIMPYTADEMFALIADVASYPEFLPWCAAARIRSRTPDGAGEVMDADLIISFKLFREKFGSRVWMRPEEGEIDVAYLDGPMRHMQNNWKFKPAEGGGCEVEFFVDFEFKSLALQTLIGLVFDEAMRRVVGAFEKRAASLYGARS